MALSTSSPNVRRHSTWTLPPESSICKLSTRHTVCLKLVESNILHCAEQCRIIDTCCHTCCPWMLRDTPVNLPSRVWPYLSRWRGATCVHHQSKSISRIHFRNLFNVHVKIFATWITIISWKGLSNINNCIYEFTYPRCLLWQFALFLHTPHCNTPMLARYLTRLSTIQ